MKILKLSANNVMKIKAFSIEPNGDTVIIGGANGAGKSSALRCVEILIGGTRRVPTEPTRQGAKGWDIVGETEEYILSRISKGAGRESTFAIEPKDGTKFSGKPSEFMASVFGPLAFDPLEFDRMDGKAQAAVLRKLVPELDFVELDERRAAIFAERTEVNRDVARLKGALDEMPPVPDGTPDEEKRTADLMAEMQRIQKHNSDNEAKRGALVSMRVQAGEAKATVTRMQAELADAEAALAALVASGKAKALEVDALEDLDVTKVQTEIEAVDEVNAAVRAKQTRAKMTEEHKTVSNESRALTEAIAHIDEQKATASKRAKYPIDGLGIDDNGVTLNGLPLNQASTAERLRCAVAIGAASNDKLKVLLVRDGALLDKTSMALLTDIAREYDTQLIIEVVGDREEATVILEDGEISEVRNGKTAERVTS